MRLHNFGEDRYKLAFFKLAFATKTILLAKNQSQQFDFLKNSIKKINEHKKQSSKLLVP